MSARNKASNIQKFNRHKSKPVFTISLSWLALFAEFPVNTSDFNIAYPVVGLNSCKGKVCNLSIRKSYCLKEGRFAYISLANYSDKHGCGIICLFNKAIQNGSVALRGV